MVKRRHYITSIFLLILPAIVIFGLTSYDSKSVTSEQDNTIEVQHEAKTHCQKKERKNHKSLS